MSNLLSKGPTITVSTSELESKIDAAAGKFIKSLSKSQKALGMSIDTMGRYVNAQGKNRDPRRSECLTVLCSMLSVLCFMLPFMERGSKDRKRFLRKR